METNFNKLRGGYYTPPEVTDFITNWAIQDKNNTILEPSCGDGHFLKDAANRLFTLGASEKEINHNIVGIELYEQEATKASKYGTNIMCGDFFGIYESILKHRRKFDVILGNPPFIRYQNFEEEYRNIAFKQVSDIGIELTKLSNIWLPFLILCSELLNENTGRLGMVIPAELFQVDYAAEARRYLSEKYEHLLIITFKKLLFEDAQQEVVLLLGECKSSRKGIEVIELQDATELSHFMPNNISTEIKCLDHSVDKWTKYYLSNEELELLKKLESNENLIPTTDLFEVNVGLVSGQNSFFIIDNNTVNSYKLQNSIIPIIGRSEQLKGILLKSSDLKLLEKQNKKIFMFVPDPDNLSDADRNYIKMGEDLNYHKGYKCRIRKNWYIVPQSWKPDAFLLRQISKYPKMVINHTEATTTDTLHKIRFLEGVNGNLVTVAFLNSYTFALSEITGRSYGGGVMTFEPGEIRKLKIPMKGAEKLDIQYIDTLMRDKKIEDVLDYTDQVLLIDGLGLSVKETQLLRSIWNKLSYRRLFRKAKQK